MANVNKVLQEMVTQVSRREARAATKKLRAFDASMRETLVALKRRVAELEKLCGKLANAAPAKAGRKTAAVADQGETPSKDAVERMRPTAKMIRALRTKFGLTQKEFAKLLNVSGQSVVLWESKEGRIRLRRSTREALLTVRGLGKRAIRRMLAE